MSAAFGAPPPPSTPPARATITFDVGSGHVLAADNAHTPERVASTFKLLTALVIRASVPVDAEVKVTARAEKVPPLKLSMTAGSTWRAGDLLHAMLIASLNDAATALAIEAGGGSLAGFHRAVTAEARRLGLADNPTLEDPAGLDGDESVGGGNLISARDLAIVTRAFLDDPLLAGIVRMQSYHFKGGDGRPHVVWNHNAFLSIYPGAIGVKTGYTERSKHSLVAAATRNGRTLATIVIGSDDPVGVATANLDAAFATPRDAAGTGDVLPAQRIAPSAVKGGDIAERPATFTATVPPATSSSLQAVAVVVITALVLALAATLVVVVRRRSPRTRAVRARIDRA